MTLVYLALAWHGGIALAQALRPSWPHLLLPTLAALLAFTLWRDEPRVRLGAVCLLTLTLGAARLLLALPHFDETSLATYNDSGWVTLEGVVVGEPDERAHYVNLRLRADRLTLPDGRTLPVEGLVLVKTDRYPQHFYGERLRVSGSLETPPVFEDFSYREYLARQRIYSLVRRARVETLAENQANPFLYHLFRFKRHAQATIARILPEPQAALLTGILLGVETGIPADLMDDFAATGTTHIIAISGFNITIIAGIFAVLARRLFGERRAVWVAIGGVLVYTIFVGASAAVVRAAIMGIIYLWGQHLDRPTFAPASLAASAIVMTAINPYTLWDVGFQLSFAATIGLVLYTDPLEQAFERALTRLTSADLAHKIISLINEALIVTLAAQITTTPIILYYFGRLSVVTLLTNFLILPAQSMVMIVGGLAAILGLIFLPLGQIVGWIAWLFLTYTIEAVRLTARIPYASLPVRMSAAMVWGYYSLLALATWWRSQPPDRRNAMLDRLTSHLETKVLFGISAVLLLLAVSAYRALPDRRLHVVVMDVGQGDAIFIQTPNGRQMLVDGGPDETVLLAQLGRQMPFWDRSLDVMLLTHPDSDHITGLVPVLERYRVDTVIFRQTDHQSAVYDYWQQLLSTEGAAVYRGETGLQITLDEGVGLTVLHPGAELVSGTEADGNNNSVVTRLTYGTLSVLLPGDIEAEVEHQLVQSGTPLASTILKVAHHGSCTSTTEEFLAAVRPQIAVISVGADNHFGHPCDEVLERLQAFGAQVYRTDEDGTVEITSDGAQMWIETQKQ